MDPREVPVRRIAGGGALLVAALALSAGCGRRPTGAGARDAVRRELREATGKELAPLNVTTTGSAFTVDDEQGRRLLEAKVQRMEGTVQPGAGLSGPVRLREVACRLFQEGRLQMHLKAPEAVWDGERLVASRRAHGVTADGRTLLDAEKAVWTARNGRLDMEQAKVRLLKNGRVDFTAEGPRAEVVQRVVTLPAGATARNAAAQQLAARHVRFHLDTGRLEARGDVRVTDPTTEITGARLVADTKLKRGRFSGDTQVRTRRPRQLASAPAPPAGRR